MVHNAPEGEKMGMMQLAYQKIQEATQAAQDMASRAYVGAKGMVTRPVNYVFGEESSNAKTAFYATVGVLVLAGAYALYRDPKGKVYISTTSPNPEEWNRARLLKQQETQATLQELQEEQAKTQARLQEAEAGRQKAQAALREAQLQEALAKQEEARARLQKTTDKISLEALRLQEMYKKEPQSFTEEHSKQLAEIAKLQESNRKDLQEQLEEIAQ
jgi:hypothetical protein